MAPSTANPPTAKPCKSAPPPTLSGGPWYADERSSRGVHSMSGVALPLDLSIAPGLSTGEHMRSASVAAWRPARRARVQPGPGTRFRIRTLRSTDPSTPGGVLGPIVHGEGVYVVPRLTDGTEYPEINSQQIETTKRRGPALPCGPSSPPLGGRPPRYVQNWDDSLDSSI